MVAFNRNGRPYDPATGQFLTAERTTTTVTERLTVVEQPPDPDPPEPVPARTSYVFRNLLRHPPAQRWAHPEFIADMAARAAAQVRRGRAAAPARDTAPATVVTVPRVYQELQPDTLAHEFTEADRDRFAWTLGELPELMP
jgi:hypothetical protein